MSWMIENADELRFSAVQRRNRGLHTGKSAAGWDVKRPDPKLDSWDYTRAVIKARLRDHWAQVRADYDAAAHPEREMPF